MKRYSIFLVLIFIASTLLVSCSSGGGDGKVNLIWWVNDSTPHVAANKKLIEKYKKVNPNVTIEMKSFPYDALLQKLKAAYASKTPPDIAGMFGTWVTEYAKQGLLLSAPDDTKKSNYFDAALGAYIVDNVLYGLPLEYNLENGGMLASPKMFQDAGVAYPPKTWDDLTNAAQKLTKREGDKIKVMGYNFLSSDNITFELLSLILQQKGKYWTDDNHVNFSSPEAKKAMQTLKDFITKYKVTDLSLFPTEETYDTFFKGNAAMAVRGPWAIAQGLTNYKAKDFEYIPIPPFTSNPPYFAAESGWGEVVAKSSKHPNEAWDFVKFATEQQQAYDWNLETFTMPANKLVAQDPKFLADQPMLKTSLDALQYGQWIGPVQDREYFFKQVNDNFQAIAREQSTVEEGLKKIETEINKMIDSHK